MNGPPRASPSRSDVDQSGTAKSRISDVATPIEEGREEEEQINRPNGIQAANRLAIPVGKNSRSANRRHRKAVSLENDRLRPPKGDSEHSRNSAMGP